MQAVAVFCGSRTGHAPVYTAAAEQLADLFLERQIRLIYGGGNVGLMGVLADRILDGGGEVVGVIPQSLVVRELAHQRVTTLHVVDSMHERKARMADLADAFLALPGGFGTLEELFEVVTWRQLGIHAKPCGLWNVAGYFDGLLTFFNRSQSDGFLHTSDLPHLIVESRPDTLLNRLSLDSQPPDRPDTVLPEI